VAPPPAPADAGVLRGRGGLLAAGPASLLPCRLLPLLLRLLLLLVVAAGATSGTPLPQRLPAS
jgi:hypothetical protein